MVNDPIQNRFPVDLLLQKLHIPSVQNIVVDASDDLFLINEIGWTSPFSIHRIEQIVLGNIYLEKLLDMLSHRGGIKERHQLRRNPEGPQVATNTPSLDAARRVVRVESKFRNSPSVQHQMLERAGVIF